MAQRTPLTQAEKKIIGEKKTGGMSLLQISTELQCSPETVRKWWRCGRDQRIVQPRGRPKRGPLSTYPQSVIEKALELKKSHPHWGPKKVRLEMKPLLSLSDRELPSPARLSVLYKQRCPEAVQPRQRRLLPPPNPKVSYVHQRWQMDAKEGIPVGTERANVQEIEDIYSGLMITSLAFLTPQTTNGWQHLHREEHQQALRWAFSEWGLPEEVQTDHDSVFVNSTDPGFPTLFTLWLIGLEVAHVLSRPHRPTDQARVERNHRTQGDFVWKDQSFEQLSAFQTALDHHRQVFNEQYPSQATHCHGHPPLVVFPTAHFSGRSYHPDLEWGLFDLKRVDAFLAKQVWTRKVAQNGTVHLADEYYILGSAWKSQWVSVTFLPDSRSFHFQTKDGAVIMDHPARRLEKDQIIGLIPAHIPMPIGFQLPLPILGGMIL
jgi:transposase InsO family protein